MILEYSPSGFSLYVVILITTFQCLIFISLGLRVKVKYVNVFISCAVIKNMELSEDANNLLGIPLSALGFKARDILCKHLDKIKVIPSPEGFPRDYRGLAQIAGVGCDDIRNPTLGVIALWSRVEPFPTFHDVVESLCRIERWDVVRDVEAVLKIDALNYSLAQRQLAITKERTSPALEDSNIVTYDDADLVKIGLPPNQRYHAFLLYADQDEDIAKEIVLRLENQFNLKLCVKDRDIIPGAGFEHEAITYLISQRCNWLIVVLTPDFLDCPAHRFIYNFSIALGLMERKNKIIPCLFRLSEDEYTNEKMRNLTNSVSVLNFTRKNPFRCNWDLLKCAIEAPRPLAVRAIKSIQPSKPVITEITESSSSQEILNHKNKKSYDESLEMPNASKQTPDRPPRYKDKLNSNGSATLDSLKHSNELSQESCSSTNSTAYLLPSQPNKSQSSLNKLVNDFKKTKLAKSCKNVLKKNKKKKNAEVIPA